MYPQLTQAAVDSLDKYGSHGAISIGALLKTFSRTEISNLLTGGAANSTVTDQLLIAPAKLEITKAQFVINTVNTGAGNVPTINLKVGDTVIATGTIALGGAVGDVVNLTVDADNVVVAKDAVIKVEVVTPNETITVAVKGKVQFEYHTVA